MLINIKLCNNLMFTYTIATDKGNRTGKRALGVFFVAKLQLKLPACFPRETLPGETVFFFLWENVPGKSDNLLPVKTVPGSIYVGHLHSDNPPQ